MDDVEAVARAMLDVEMFDGDRFSDWLAFVTDDEMTVVRDLTQVAIAASREAIEREAEARIVAWLRDRAEIHRSKWAVSVDPVIRQLADAIEARQHLERGER